MFLYGQKSRVGAIFPDKSLARIQVTLRFTTPSAARAESVLLGVKQQVRPGRLRRGFAT